VSALSRRASNGWTRRRVLDSSVPPCAEQGSVTVVQRVDPHPKARPRFIEPMECQRVAKLPEGERWVYEPKQDGYRVVAVIDGSAALLHSMSGLDYTRKYPHIAEALKWLKLRQAVFDGEVVALDELGRANFQELQNARLTRLPIVYYIFDILHAHGRDLLDRPLSERRELLEELGTRFSDPLRLNPSFKVPLATFIEQVRRLELEGIVAKRLDSIYVPGQESDAWRKHRFNQEGEFVIGGYVRAGRNFSSLVVGEYRGKDLYYVKRVAAGFTPPLREQVFQALRGLETSRCPFVNLPEAGRSGHGLTAEKMRECVWLKPERKCELEFVERTKGGRLRHAEFRRLAG
jgi:DNA ligase D-like protein (predicted ligase)